jgi:ABC-type transport system involved in cytochrome c biogenesis ATPase subunit
MLRFLDVVKRYPRTGEALHGVSFALEKGEFAFLTGPSGAGKSTILKLARLEEWPTTGEVQVGSFSSARMKRGDVPLLRRQLGVIFQDFRLLPDRTVEQNVAFALEATGAPRGVVRERAARALAQVGLAAKGTGLPHELSGGEQQRVRSRAPWPTSRSCCWPTSPPATSTTALARRLPAAARDLRRRHGGADGHPQPRARAPLGPARHRTRSRPHRRRCRGRLRRATPPRHRGARLDHAAGRRRMSADA